MGREDCLNDTLESLSKQTYKDFEVLLITDKGDLSRLRDSGLRSAIGTIVCFIDDDVYCSETWLSNVVRVFKEKKEVVGVSGPTTITDAFRNNRDLFRFKRWKALYDLWFLGRKAAIPGMLGNCGAPSTASNDSGCSFEGEVDYLEACNMSVKRKEAIDVGGYDYKYYRTSEWCEVDLSLKLGQRGKLWFAPNCKLAHRPSKAGVYKERLATKHRWDNFIYFQRKWVKPGFKTYTYRGFIWLYLKLKSHRMI